MEVFMKIVNGFRLSIIFAKIYILDAWQDSEYPLQYLYFIRQ